MPTLRKGRKTIKVSYSKKSSKLLRRLLKKGYKRLQKGVPVGYKIPGWAYQGRWSETKVKPKTWKFSFRATKKRKAKGYGGHPKGRRIRWAITGKQDVIKTGQGQYQINYNATPFTYILQSNITNPYDNTLNLTTNWIQYTNSMNFNYTLRRQDFADNITATISICTTWACYNYSALNYTINQIDHNIQFIPRSNLSNTTLTNINLNFLDKGIITNSTPYTTTLSTFLNYSMRHNSTQINVTHLPQQYVNNLYNYNITENMTSIYLYLQPNPFTLNFFLGDAAYNVYGTCMHGNGSVSWFNESIVTYQQNFSQGKVECQFSKFNQKKTRNQNTNRHLG